MRGLMAGAPLSAAGIVRLDGAGVNAVALAALNAD